VGFLPQNALTAANLFTTKMLALGGKIFAAEIAPTRGRFITIQTQNVG